MLFMLGTWDGGLRIAGAAALAVETVNSDKMLLPDFVFNFSWANSGCSPKLSLASFGELLRGDSRIDAVIGPACTSACAVTSYLSEGQRLPQISYGSLSPLSSFSS